MAAIFEANIHDDDYLSNYSRPLLTYNEMIFDSGRARESLNGSWRFCIDPYDTCLRGRWFHETGFDAAGRPVPLDFDFGSWEEVTVPSCWNMQTAEYRYYEGPAVYTRTFRFTSEEDEHAVLKFGGVNYHARIFLNGEFIGLHTGGSLPFYVDCTGKLKAENRLVVVVDNTRRKEQIPAENFGWFNYGGIFRGVELLRLPPRFIRDFSLQLDPGSDYSRLICRVETNILEEESEPLTLRIPDLGIEVSLPVVGGKVEAKIPAAPELWSPESPRLYRVEAEWCGDRISDQVGFREIVVAGRDILLNGKKIYLKGVCCHEESVQSGRTLTPEELTENLLLARDMGCNYIRLTHYPHSEEIIRAADRFGLLVWEEIPVYWAIDFHGEAARNDAENQLRELIRRDRNRASVIIWSIGNENADTDERLRFMSALAAAAREMDETRLISAACLYDKEELIISDRLAAVVDLIGINEYYGWYDPDYGKLPRLLANSDPEKPVIIAEFGGGAAPGQHGTVEDLFSEERQAEIYRRQVAHFRDNPYIRGTSPWILYDYRCPRRQNGFQRGYNLKGLLSADKGHRKLAFEVMREFYASIDD